MFKQSLRTKAHLERAAWIFLVSTLLGLMFFSQSWISAVPEKPFYWKQQLEWIMASWYLWGGLFPVLYRFSRRFPVDNNRWKKSIPLQIAMGLGVSVLHATFQITFNHFPNMSPSERNTIDLGLFVAMVMWR